MIDYDKIYKGYAEKIPPTKLLDSFEELLNALKKENPDLKTNYNINEIINSIASNFTKKVKKDFLTRALSTDKSRVALTLIYNDADNDCLVTTDGKRLHIQHGATETENCLLLPNKSRSLDQGLNFPNYLEVLDHVKNKCHINRYCKIFLSKNYALITSDQGTNYLFNGNQYRDLDITACDIYLPDDRNSPVFFDMPRDKTSAVLCPLNQDMMKEDEEYLKLIELASKN